ncbi:MAG: RNA methyltransferase [Bacteroidales bacterium]|nr:RNA methyltransferase [Bacteroidales bacterium]MDT8432746.1 RNA methyltransferase [Bacteroidales bacterium]
MTEYDKAFREFLLPMVNENRLELIDRVLKDRTRYITILLEDIYQSHNASAVLRTCDCFGIQDVHIVENRNTYELNPDVELGAAQWLTLHTYNKEGNNTLPAIRSLKEKGYRVVAATPHTNEVEVADLDLDKGRVAIMLGTEMKGLSESALSLADEYVKIPMAGFTESFNISVSAAIILYELNARLRSSFLDWKMKPSENEEIRYQWIRNSVNHIVRIEKGFKKKYCG